ncbi:MAG: SDR family NAD(P)-dependent oxidoreductase [Hyphomicrobiaceae bacterium]|nr:MAG: SDR family NAD(P)-dependent oxidoreductase [Hyphomicrobiaceae bacterium]
MTASPVAVVSGGSSGIGLAVVKRLLAEGWRVALFSQQAARIEAVERELSAKHGAERVMARTADLREPPAVQRFLKEAERAWGRIDALICNAGFSPKGPAGRTPLAEIELSEWNDVLTVNLTGAFVCCQAVLPGMAARRHGRIVFIGSLAGRTTPRIAGASYAASKSALTGLMRVIVSEHSASGVTANTICPGRIMTEMAGNPNSPENQAALARIPCGRFGQPDDVGRLVSFLIADDAGFINGATIDLNGGEFVAP